MQTLLSPMRSRFSGPSGKIPAAVMLAMSLAGGETTKVTPSAAAVQAKAETPAAAKVERVCLPFEKNVARFVAAVVPFAGGAVLGGAPQALPAAPQADGSVVGIATSGLHGGGLDGGLAPGAARSCNIGQGMATQLKTALMRWGNVALVDAAALVRQPDGTYACKPEPGELGPFIVRGTITEFNEASEGAGQKKGASLGGVGAALGILGAYAGAGALANVGGAVAAANPTVQNEERTRKGAVGVDLEEFDGRSTRIVGALACSCTFTTKSAVNGVSVFGMGGGGAAFAASALGKATRAALNDAIKQTAEVLNRAPGAAAAAK